MFNAFVWQLYKESERGKRAIEHCSRFSDALHDGTFLTLLFGMSLNTAEKGWDTDPYSAELIKAAQLFAAETKVTSPQHATALFESVVATGLTFTPPNETEPVMLIAKDITSSVHEISIGLHLAHPEYFIPYGFVTLFDFLQRIGELFNLTLPPVPGKQDIAGRGRYYAQLNEAFYEFRQSYGLSVVEMCAFLYDFAPRLLEKVGDLPEPSKVWPIIAGAYYEADHDWLEQATEESQTPFNGHPDMRRGDVLLVYGVSRHKELSFISHVGRALLDGFKDPFCYFYDVVWLGHLTPVTPVHFRELKAHPKLSQSTHIRTHMKGPGSGSFTLEEYDAILGIMASKGQDISQLLKLRTVSFLPSTELRNERDVEFALIEPLLLHLGYTEKDWLRQMRLRMGRGERIYPDYVFGAQVKRGEERADMVLEAKFTISGEKALRESYAQAVSYAYRLRAEVVMLGAREGLWLFKQKRGSFSLASFSFYDWNVLQNSDALFELGKSLVKPKR